MPIRKVRMIYIVDDDAAVRESLATLLETTGVDTMAFKDPRSFLDANFNQKDDLDGTCLLLDLDLGDPDMDGLDMIAALKAAGRQVPFVLISGRLGAKDAGRARDAGAAAILAKPVGYPVLVEAINSAIGKAA